MVADTYTPRALAKHRDPLTIASEPGDESLDPEQCVSLVIQRQIRILTRGLEVSQCAETVLDARADDGLGVSDGLLHYQGGAVLGVDFAEDEAAAVDVD